MMAWTPDDVASAKHNARLRAAGLTWEVIDGITGSAGIDRALRDRQAEIEREMDLLRAQSALVVTLRAEGLR